jgi:hypothetical protein
MFVLKKSGGGEINNKSEIFWKGVLMVAYFGTLRGIYVFNKTFLEQK